MRLITLNIWGGHIYSPLLEFIAAHRETDIFCFQEVYHNAESKMSDDDKKVSLNIFSELQALLPKHNAFFRPVVKGTYGIGTFVKKDITVLDEGEIQIHNKKLGFTWYLDNLLVDEKLLNLLRPLQVFSAHGHLVDLIGKYEGIIIISTNAIPGELLESFERECEIITVNVPQTETKSKIPVYKWSIKNNQEVYSNNRMVAKIPNLQFKIFDALKIKAGKFVKRNTLEACWVTKPNYESFLTEAINKLETTLREGLGSEESIIERKKNGKVIEAYKLPP